MELEQEVAAARDTAQALAGEGEEVDGVVPAEPGDGMRVYVCAFRRGDDVSWLALDAAREPVYDRSLVHDAVAIAALCEVAEESAGGGDLDALRARLAELKEAENPEGIEEAEAAAAALAALLRRQPRVASVAYLDAVGAAARELERTLGATSGSPFAQAMKAGMPAVDDLAGEVERRYRGDLS